MHLRLAVPSVFELTVLCLFTGAVQLAFLALSIARAKRRPRPAEGPSVQVVVPCKGLPPGLEGNAAAYRAQAYPGRAAVLFVVPDASDPAHAVLAGVCAAAGGLPARVAASGAVPGRCAGKAADLVWALRAAGDGSELLVFADADQRPDAGWLAALTAPLADPGVAVATSAAVPVPDRAAFWGVMRMLWVACGLPFFDALGMVCGQSTAARRRDLAAWGVAELWERVVLEDLALAERVRERGGRVVFVHDAMPAAREACAAAEFWGVFNKWTMCFRFYERRLWALGLLLTAFKAYCLWRGLALRLRPGLLAALWLPDAVFAVLLMLWLRARRPGNFAGFPGGAAGLALASALGAPLLPLAHAVNFAQSLGPPRVRWGGRVYRFRAADDVVVEEASRA